MVCVCSTLANLISACATSPTVRMHMHTHCDAEALPGPHTCCFQSAYSSLLPNLPPAFPSRAWIPTESPECQCLHKHGRTMGPGPCCFHMLAAVARCRSRHGGRAGFPAHPSELLRANPCTELWPDPSGSTEPRAWHRGTSTPGRSTWIP